MPAYTSLARISCLITLFASAHAGAAVLLTTLPVAPLPGPFDQYSLDQSGSANPGTDFGDNNGVPGQSFTVPAGAPVYLDSVSYKVNIANTFSGFSAPWGVQIARFDNLASGGFGERTDSNGTAYSAEYLNAGFTKVAYTSLAAPAQPTTDVWITATFDGPDRLTLLPGTTYSFQMFNAAGGYVNFYRGSGDTYAGGIGFNPYGGSRQFNDNYVTPGDTADRTFHVGLSAIPEPAAIGLLLPAIPLSLRRRK